jgi:hypothetical protein
VIASETSGLAVAGKAPEAAREMTLVFVAGLSVVGRIRDVAGAALAGFTVHARNEEVSLSGAADVDGRFLLRGLRDDSPISISFSSPEGAPASPFTGSGEGLVKLEGRVCLAKPPAKLDLVLELMPVVRGRVVDRDGRFVAGARIRARGRLAPDADWRDIYSDRAWPPTAAVTDAGGRFAIPLNFGYDVDSERTTSVELIVVFAPAPVTTRTFDGPFTAASDVGALELDLSRPHRLIVVDAEGEPVGAVEVKYQGAPPEAVGWTDAHGAINAYKPDDAPFTISHPRFSPLRLDVGAAPSPDAPPRRVVLGGGAALIVRIKPPAVAGERIEIRSVVEGGGEEIASGVTDAAGQTRWSHFPPDVPFEIRLVDPSTHDPIPGASRTEAPLKTNETRVVDLDAPPLTGLALRVVDADGARIDTATLITPDGARYGRSSHGQYAGRYVVPSKRRASSSVPVRVVAPGFVAVERELALTEAAFSATVALATAADRGRDVVVRLKVGSDSYGSPYSARLYEEDGDYDDVQRSGTDGIRFRFVPRRAMKLEVTDFGSKLERTVAATEETVDFVLK